jgi:hypothetical protein
MDTIQYGLLIAVILCLFLLVGQMPFLAVTERTIAYLSIVALIGGSVIFAIKK